jgi:hypothetical protein
MILALKPCARAAASKVVAAAADIFGQQFSDKIDHKDSMAARKTQAAAIKHNLLAILFFSRRARSVLSINTSLRRQHLSAAAASCSHASCRAVARGQ